MMEIVTNGGVCCLEFLTVTGSVVLIVEGVSLVPLGHPEGGAHAENGNGGPGDFGGEAHDVRVGVVVVVVVAVLRDGDVVMV